MTSRLFNPEDIYQPTYNDIAAMLSHPAVRAAITLYTLPVQQAGIQVEGSEEQKQFLEDWYSNYYGRFVRVYEEGLKWGRAAGEVAMEPRDGLWWPARVILPHPTHINWVYDKDGVIIGFEFDGKTVPLEKAIYYINDGDEFNNPDGVPLPAYAFWAYKSFLEAYARWRALQTRYAIPTRVVKYPANEVYDINGSKIPAQSIAEQIARNLRDQSWAAIPVSVDRNGKPTTAWEIQVIEAGQVSSDILLEAISKAENWIYQSMVAPKKLIEQEAATGSYALAKVQADAFILMLRGRLRAWEAALWRVLKHALEANFGKVDVRFKLVIFPEQERALKVELLKELVRRGDVYIDGNSLAKALDLPIQEFEIRGAATQALELESPLETLKRTLPKQVYADLKRRLNKRAEARKRELQPLIDLTTQKIAANLTEWAEKQSGAFQKKKNLTAKDLMITVPAKAFNPLIDTVREVYFMAVKEIFKKAGRPLPKKITPELSTRWFEVIRIGKRDAEVLTDRLRFAVADLSTPAEIAKAIEQTVAHYVSKTLPRAVQSYVYKAHGDALTWAAKQVVQK